MATLREILYPDGVVPKQAFYDWLLALVPGIQASEYGLAADGTTSDLAALQEALDDADDAGGGIVHLPRARIMVGGTLVLAPGVYIQGNGATLINARITVTGTAGSEIEIDDALTAGENVIPCDPTGLVAGDVVYLKSCINALSPDAGTRQLGPINGDYAYLAEFGRIESVDEDSVTLAGGLRYPYSDTPGSYSGARTHSTINKVTLADSWIDNVHFEGQAATLMANVEFTWCAKPRLTNWTTSLGDAEGFACLYDRCNGGLVEGFLIERTSYLGLLAKAITPGSTRNSIKTYGSSDIDVSDGTVDGGNQCIDFSYRALGAPSINCGFDNLRTMNCRDGMTTHDGCDGGHMRHSTVSSASRGVRVRCPGIEIESMIFEGLGMGGIGLLLSGGFCHGFNAHDNTFRGFQYAIQVIPADSVEPLRGKIHDETMIDCESICVYVTRDTDTPGTATDDRLAIEIENITAIRAGRRVVYVTEYCNGVSVKDVLAVGAFSSGDPRAIVEFKANTTDLVIDDIRGIDIGADVALVRGPGSTQISDMTTFPAGESAANLLIGKCNGAGLHNGVIAIPSSVAAYSSQPDRYGNFTVNGQLTLSGVKVDASACATTAAIGGKQSIWEPALGMTPRLTNGAAVGLIETSGNKVMLATLDFDAGTQEFVQFSIRMPKSWNEGTVTFAPIWSHSATTTNFGVVFSLAGVAISNDDAGDAAFGTAVTSTDTGGTTNDIYEGPESAAITIAGTPAAGDFVVFQIARVPADAADTLAVDARLHGIVLYITTDAGNDA